MLRKLLHGRLAGWEEARSLKEIHASDVTGESFSTGLFGTIDNEFCPREVILLDKHKKVKRRGQFINTCLRTTFDNGNDTATRIICKYLPDVAFGHWRCIKCKLLHDYRTVPNICSGSCTNTPGELGFRYEEINFIDPKTDLSGSVDFLFQAPGKKKLKIVELKILQADQFKAMVVPKAKHRVRTTIYLELIKRAKNIPERVRKSLDLTSAIILYTSRGYGIKDDSVVDLEVKDQAFSPFKEFVVKADPKNVQDYFKAAQIVKQHRGFYRAGVRDKLPKRCESCTDSGCKRAKACSVTKQCWGK